MTNSDFNLVAALETLRSTDGAALDKLLLEEAADGNVDAVVVLLNAGAGIDAKGVYDWTPLHLAASNGQTATAAQLIAKGAAIDPKDSDSRTPLHYAALNGHIAIADQLIAKGAAMDAKDDFGRTPLHLAAHNSHTAMAERLGQPPRNPLPIERIRAALKALQQG
jgi:ankyrin repeat protein